MMIKKIMIVRKGVLVLILNAVLSWSSGVIAGNVSDGIGDEKKNRDGGTTSVKPEKKGESGSGNIDENTTIVINFSDQDGVKYNRWDAVADSVKISRWAQTRKLVPVPDRGPVVDRNASFVSEFGSTVEIKKLDPNKNYVLYIDFVSYQKGNGGISSRLSIKADGERIADIPFGGQNTGKLYMIPIPRNIIYDGMVVLLFEESATTAGVWGIWDMLITAGEIPSEIEVKKKIPKISNKEQDLLETKKGDSGKKKHGTEKGKKENEGTGEKPVPKEKPEEKKIVEPKVSDINDLKKPEQPAITEIRGPDIDSGKIREPEVREPDIGD